MSEQILEDTPILEFVTLVTATREGPYDTEAHTRRVLVSDEYAHLDPRPRFYYPGGDGRGVLIRSEWEAFKRRLISERQKGPRRSPYMEKRRALRLIREGIEGGEPRK